MASVSEEKSQPTPSWIDRLAPEDVLGFVLMATLFTVIIELMTPGKPPWLLKGSMAIGTAMILFRGQLRSPLLWGVLTGMWAVATIGDATYVNNHQFLLCYWCLAITFALMVDAPQGHAILRVNGRVLLLLCMGFAVLWKLISRDFADGSFLEFMFLVDQRFGYMADLLGLLRSDWVSMNRESLKFLLGSHLYGPEALSIKLIGGEKVRLIAQMMAYWTIVIEAAIFVAFLAPDRWKEKSSMIYWARALLVGIFVASTYLVAPVVGFGWLLLVMTIAQTPSELKAIRVMLVGLLVFNTLMPASTWIDMIRTL